MVPVLWLVGFNWFAMHSVTGYDTTKESTGFDWKKLPENWEFVFHELYDFGTFLIMPLALMGLIVMWRWSWRAALLVTLWLVPSLVIYTIYYWGSGLQGVGFLRFMQTLFPPIIVAAVWFLRHGAWNSRNDGESRGSVAMPLAAGCVVAFATLIGLRNAMPVMQRELALDWNLEYTCQSIVQNVPKDSVLIVDQNVWMGGILNFIQWRGDYELYAADAFRKMAILMRFQPDPSRPHPIQSARQTYVGTVYEKLDSNDLQKKQDEVIDTALKQGRRAFCLLPLDKKNKIFQRTINVGPGFEEKVVKRWNELAPVSSVTNTELAPRERDWLGVEQPQTWQLIEIVRKAPAAAAPATAPALVPAPPPATTRPTTAPSADSSNDGSDD